MKLPEWMRRRWRPSGPPSPWDGETVTDPESGEILPLRRKDGAARQQLPGQEESLGVAGERGIPSVNKGRSLQARISTTLMIATGALLVSGFLVWYYAAHFANAHAAREAADKALHARSGGEMRLPPLGRVDPPRPASAAVVADAPAPQSPAPRTPSTASAPPTKTPEELALERMLSQPVLLRTRSAMARSADAAPAAPPPTLQASLSALLGGSTHTVAKPPLETDPTLSQQLRPTVTPAVAARLLPTRRMLLPKGTSIDCTLQTAVDSTYDGLVTCVGAADVYSADGQAVLLERGTQYIGEKRGGVQHGRSRIFVLWSEARTPRGVVVQLDSPGADSLGRSGLPGEVNRHFWDRFGAALLITVVDGTVRALGGGRQSGGNRVVLNPDAARDIATEALRATADIRPTVVKPQGDRVQVMVARDVDFRAVYGGDPNE